MLVTKLEEITKKKYRIYLNDAPMFLLNRDEISEYRITEGQDLSDDCLGIIYEQVLRRRAIQKCMDLLKMMDKTEYQLRQKLLQEEYPQEIIGKALEYVKSFHYVDDVRYAENYIRSKSETRSRQEITTQLLGKGIAHEDIETAWENSGTADETVLILRLAEKKHFDPEDADEKERQKFYQFLLRKGFLYTDIKKALT